MTSIKIIEAQKLKSTKAEIKEIPEQSQTPKLSQEKPVLLCSCMVPMKVFGVSQNLVLPPLLSAPSPSLYPHQPE